MKQQNELVDRLKKAFEVESDYQLSKVLEVDRAQISRIRRRMFPFYQRMIDKLLSIIEKHEKL